jgi:O-antigen/teichoic acid export membrane protein
MLSGSTALAQGIAILATPLLTRIFTPEDFGCLSIFAAFLGVSAVVCGFRYEVAITQAKTEAAKIQLFYLSLLITALVSAVLLLCLSGFAETLSRALDAPQMTKFWWFVGAGTLAIGIYNACYYLALANKNYKALAQSRLLQGFVSPAVSMGIGYLVAGPLGLLVGNIVSSSAGATVLFRGNYKQGAAGQSTRAGLWQTAVEYKSYPLYGTGAALFNALGLVLAPIMIVRLYGVEAAGFYALANRLVSMPLSVVGTSIGQVFLGEASAAWRTDKQSLAGIARKTQRRLLPLVGCVLAGGAVSPWIFPVVFGREWHLAGLFAAALCVQAAARLYTSPISTIVYILERQKTQLILDVVRLVLLVASLLAARYYSPNPFRAVLFSSLTLTGVYAISALWYGTLIKNGESSNAPHNPRETSTRD